eukprot:3979027-Pleurochrysis_carterae.AAC.5
MACSCKCSLAICVRLVSEAYLTNLSCVAYACRRSGWARRHRPAFGGAEGQHGADDALPQRCVYCAWRFRGMSCVCVHWDAASDLICLQNLAACTGMLSDTAGLWRLRAVHRFGACHRARWFCSLGLHVGAVGRMRENGPHSRAQRFPALAASFSEELTGYERRTGHAFADFQVGPDGFVPLAQALK